MAKGKYTKLIAEYCAQRGYTVPAGFFRRSASHLCVVRMDVSPPKLVATTWFKREDVVYYAEHNTPKESAPRLRIFDFKTNEELEHTGGKALKRKSHIEDNP
jgi:hypothetical protein